MIEETVRVTEISGDRAHVEAMQRKSGCGGCSAGATCGTGNLSKVLGRHRLRLWVHNPIGASTGDTVIIGLPDEALVRSSFAVYLIPLMAMMAAALAGETFLSAYLGEAGVALAGLCGLAAGFGLVSVLARRVAADPKYRPVILRVASNLGSPVTFQR